MISSPSLATRASSLGLVLLGLVGTSGPGLAQLTLTTDGISRGFQITTFASGFSFNTGQIGPLGIAYRTDGKVLVTDFDSFNAGSTIYVLPSHAGGQTSPFPGAVHYTYGDASGLAQIQVGTTWKYFLGQQVAGKIVEIDSDGNYLADVVTGMNAPTGMAPYPPSAAVGPLTGHMFVTDGLNNIWNVDPFGIPGGTPGTNVTAFKLAAGVGADGLSFSPDGSIVYVAFVVDNVVRAYDTSTSNLLWTSPFIGGGPDGTAIGLGTLTGYIYVNCNNGEVWELGVPGGPHAGAAPLKIAHNGSRGDFIAVDPNIWSGGAFPSLLLTQTDRIMRMDPPGGGWFGPPTSSPDPVLCLTCFPRLCEPGSGGVIGCPCSNPPGGPARGCNNHGTETGGATLDGSGTPSLTTDNVTLNARDENASALTVFWTGNNLIAPPGVLHGAGVRCVSGLHRLYSGSASSGAITRPRITDPSVSARSAAVGAPISAGETRYYFTIYRDPQAATPCANTASTINMSNAVSAMWTP